MAYAPRRSCSRSYGRHPDCSVMKSCNIRPRTRIFNSGVLLINLVLARTPYRLRRYPERIIFNDQDLLNCVLHRHKTLVGLQWNVQDGFSQPPLSPEWHRTHAEILKTSGALHQPEAVELRQPTPFTECFQYLDLTPWKGERPWHSVKNRFKRFSVYYLFILE